MSDYTTTLISQCLNGERTRDCQWCQAHHSKNGTCCFGIRHAYHDQICDPCILTRECAAMCHQAPANGPRPIVYPSRAAQSYPTQQVRTNNPAPYSPVNRAAALRQYGPQPGEAMLAQAPVEVMPLQLNPNDNLFVRFCKVSSWGAGEGFFEMALNFFRRRRPE